MTNNDSIRDFCFSIIWGKICDGLKTILSVWNIQTSSLLIGRKQREENEILETNEISSHFVESKILYIILPLDVISSVVSVV